VTVTAASQEADVKAVLSKVALGEADAGIVYVTDVKAAGAAVEGVAIAPALSVVAEYPIVILKDSQNRALARAFVSYVLTDGRQTLANYGFTNP
jgi:molybdate transport system substrate-binding protein